MDEVHNLVISEAANQRHKKQVFINRYKWHNLISINYDWN